MKIFNKYTYLFLGILVIATIVIFNFIPNLETEEFDQEVIDDIIEGVTTTTIEENSEQNTQESISSLDARTFFNAFIYVLTSTAILALGWKYKETVPRPLIPVDQ